MITREQLQQISQAGNAQPVSEVTVSQLRKKFPDIHFTYCMDDDVSSANPVHEERAFNLYLIDSSNHCLSFTQDLEAATGVVLAEIEEE